MAINKQHIKNIFDQKSSLKDQKKMAAYFESDDLNQEAKKHLHDQWSDFSPNEKDTPELDHVFYKMYYSINKNESTGLKPSLGYRWMQIAAILVVGILISSTILFTDIFRNVGETQQVEFVSTTGFRNQFKLPDGTSGWLGHGSKLAYHNDEDGRRIVKLDGIAYFDVFKNPEQPFIVNTPTKLDVEVLGTRFNVVSFENEGICEVVLEEGLVGLNMNDQKLGELIPNERIVYHVASDSIVKSTVNAQDYIAWKDGKLILNDVSLQETCFKMGRFYNADFELQLNGMDDQRVRLRLQDESLDEALNLLSVLFPVDYTVVERKINENNSYSKKKIIIKNK